MLITVHSRQSLLDIAVQESGAVDAAFELAAQNGMALTDPLAVGTVLTFNGAAVDKRVADYLAARNIRPATELSAEEVEIAPYGGIGYMGIEIDFMVR